MTAALLLAALLAAPSPRPAPAAPAPPADAAERAERIELLLGDLHGRAAPEAWRVLGPEAASDLTRLAEDSAALPSRRARAVEGLSFLGGPEAERAIRALAARDGLPPVVRVEALLAAGRLLAPAELAQVVGAALRAAPHPYERAVAAEVLASRGPAGACAEVRAQAAREATRDRAGFARALDRCAAQGR